MRVKKFIFVAFINVLIASLMFYFYTVSGSLALFAEFVHNTCDFLCLSIAAFSSYLSGLKPSQKRSYGYLRAEILSALLNAGIIAFASVSILTRIRVSRPVGSYMITAAGMAVPLNSIGYLSLKRDESLNARAVRLHLLIDAAFSALIVFAGFAVSFGYYWIDAAVAAVIAIQMLIHSTKICVKSIKILMQFSPECMDIKEVTSAIKNVPGVKDVHHVHAWQIDEFNVHFECHVMLDCSISLREADEVRRKIEELLREKGINHTTLQVECSCSNEQCEINRSAAAA